LTVFGYASVSTDGQTLDAQVKELRAGGAERGFKEKINGAVTDRARLRRAIEALGKGDVLLVTRLDRLARSTRDLLNTLADIAPKDAGSRSLRDSWADTTTAHGRLMLTVLAGLAEFERELIRSRTGEGRERAKARGVRLGRKPKLTPHQRREAIERRAAGEPITEIGRTFNVSHSTISRLRLISIAEGTRAARTATCFFGARSGELRASPGKSVALSALVASVSRRTLPQFSRRRSCNYQAMSPQPRGL
jgi:DNA invertase Pin-like site-specific DNA recombinase